MSQAVEPTPPVDEVEASRMPLIDHLIELRNRMMWALGGLALGMVVSLAYAEEVYRWLTAPFNKALLDANVDGALAIVNSPFEGVYTYLRVAFFGGIVLSSPVLAYQVWRFVAPGLYSNERRVVVPLAFCSTVLFGGGAGFCYYVIFPYAFPFFLNVVEAEASLSIAGYLSAVVRMMGAFGLSFQLPVATWFAARAGLLDHKDMIGGFRYAVVGIFVIAAILTPPDVLTQSLLAAPLIVLYALSIGIAWASTTKQRIEDLTEGS